MSKVPARAFYQDYCKALDWVQLLITEMPANCRFNKYREVLGEQISYLTPGKATFFSNYLEFRSYMHAQLEAFSLIEIHKRFFDRTDIAFKNKLREMLFGPFYESDEKPNASKKNNGFGRNIQSEFLFATRCRNPNIISFTENDIVYNLDGINLGVECKRFHSNSKMVNRFKEACEQLEQNPNIQYGIVALNFSKFRFKYEGQGIYLLNPLLLKRDETIFQAKDENAEADDATRQVATFDEKYSKLFSNLARKSKKVIAYCVFLFRPIYLPELSTAISPLQMRFMPFNNGDAKRLDAFNKFARELQ